MPYISIFKLLMTSAPCPASNRPKTNKGISKSFLYRRGLSVINRRYLCINFSLDSELPSEPVIGCLDLYYHSDIQQLLIGLAEKNLKPFCCEIVDTTKDIMSQSAHSQYRAELYKLADLQNNLVPVRTTSSRVICS